jgi:site-specific DNA-cytosine methylase
MMPHPTKSPRSRACLNIHSHFQFLKKQFPDIDDRLYFSDVAELKTSKLLEDVTIDVVTAGFPCQGTSTNNTYTRNGCGHKVQQPCQPLR